MGQRYVTIQEWMLDLGLKGNELIAFALIWGFSMDGYSRFMGSQTYIAKWLGVTDDNARANLKRLEAKGLIEKHVRYEGGVKYCDYRVTPNIWSAKIAGGSAETAVGGSAETAVGGSAETAPHINSSIIDINNIDNKESKESLALPFDSPEFKNTWNELLSTKKWRKKEFLAIKKSLKLLGEYSEADAIKMMENAIAGEWQGLHPLSTRKASQQDSDEERRRREREQAEAHAKNTAFLHSIGVLKD